MPNFIKIKKLLWTSGRTYVHMYRETFETHFIGLDRKSRPKKIQET